ncbi:LysR family transcriptional regulator [Actibacterium sp. XHP0104]|uniref:LysR family transcriptional regulator n=1 Tax=Actibacterium sp. XHP0104 TaxID=2984335 RepID=UPI0021E946EE|nr:LysR family transcriptional regulator [Actibacterium sp. XHP0104]MCV2880598.1 LysR family transcriptional regulator [Actibacterium sp. XHP0104]
MPRNLDLTALRSFVAVSEAGGVTRAAGFLNLTQSAVSMQIKRLEEALDLQLLDRSARQIALTASGEQLLGYAKRMLALNDEIYARLTAQEYEGEIMLGVPHDIVYPSIPQVMQRFHADYPRMKVHLLSSFTKELKAQFARGEVDAILTTEGLPDEGGETLIELPLVWVGAQNGQAWRGRPLRLAYEYNCRFRAPVQQALDAAGIPWEMAVESNSSRTVEATVTADLAVHTVMEGAEPPHLERINHNGALPDLPTFKVNLYVAGIGTKGPLQDLAELIRQTYRNGWSARGLSRS